MEIFRYLIASLVVKTTSLSSKDIVLTPFPHICPYLSGFVCILHTIFQVGRLVIHNLLIRNINVLLTAKMGGERFPLKKYNSGLVNSNFAIVFCFIDYGWK